MMPFRQSVYDIVDLVEAQYKLSKENPEEPAYLPISHVHDTLILPSHRLVS